MGSLLPDCHVQLDQCGQQNCPDNGKQQRRIPWAVSQLIGLQFPAHKIAIAAGQGTQYCAELQAQLAQELETVTEIEGKSQP